MNIAWLAANVMAATTPTRMLSLMRDSQDSATAAASAAGATQQAAAANETPGWASPQ